VANLDEHLLSVLATLEECRAALVVSGNRETAQLISVAILDIRMKLNGVVDEELKALCDEISRDRKSSHGQRRRPLLRVVK
jgi:hypothetical protein